LKTANLPEEFDGTQAKH